MKKEKPYLKINCVIEPNGKIMRNVQLSGMSFHEAIGIIEGLKYDLIVMAEAGKTEES